ncbi:hypothetical protein CSAL01_03327 [Colletotrichum salicis]|uniref:Zn(2)-C6 fungal-type domain-containing protein n=1 Tax=Colletotrichum salicis TaxID=1209931 RepID=A0A135TIB8_9PEZI|nr:hypothetical protein CSAL01_03327 [Colletotrichum salicis]
MTLGPQCWRCRKKRLRCDSSIPACRKCIAADTECPGYGDKRPITFRDPLVLKQKGVVIRVRDREPEGRQDRDRGKTRSGRSSSSPPASVLGIVCRSPRTAGPVMKLRITADAMEYYNRHVAPDLVPYSTSTSPYQISPHQIASLASYLPNTYISIAAFHRHISGQPSSSSSSSILSKLSNHNKTLAISPTRPFIQTKCSNIRRYMRSVQTHGGRRLQNRPLRVSSRRITSPRSRTLRISPTSRDQLIDHRRRSGCLSHHLPLSVAPLPPLRQPLFLPILLLLPLSHRTIKHYQILTPLKIQFSAYAPWQSHITGAWSIILTYGPFTAVAKSDLELCRLLQQFAIFDIFGTSTHGDITLNEPSVAGTILARQESYEAIFQESDANTHNPWRLVAHDLAKVLIRINGLRARRALYPETEKHFPEGLSAVLQYIDTSPPKKWAAKISATAESWLAPSKLSEDQEIKDAWVALMATYHAAAALYAINGLAGLGTTQRSSTAWSQEAVSHLASRESAAYTALVASLRVLFTQRTQRHHLHANKTPSNSIATSAGLLHKFVIWPMVIGGIQSALIYHDEETTNFMCSGMQAVGEELGTTKVSPKGHLSIKSRDPLGAWDHPPRKTGFRGLAPPSNTGSDSQASPMCPGRSSESSACL